MLGIHAKLVFLHPDVSCLDLYAHCVVYNFSYCFECAFLSAFWLYVILLAFYSSSPVKRMNIYIELFTKKKVLYKYTSILSREGVFQDQGWDRMQSFSSSLS